MHLIAMEDLRYGGPSLWRAIFRYGGPSLWRAIPVYTGLHGVDAVAIPIIRPNDLTQWPSLGVWQHV